MAVRKQLLVHSNCDKLLLNFDWEEALIAFFNRFYGPTFCMLLLVGCVTVGEHPGPIAELAPRSDGIENIEVQREYIFYGSGRTHYLMINGKAVKKLRAGKTVMFGLEPGRYQIGVRCPVSKGSSKLPLSVVKWVGDDIELTVDGTDRIRFLHPQFGIVEALQGASNGIIMNNCTLVQQ